MRKITLQELLIAERRKRGFDPKTYYENKLSAINNFFSSQNLDSAVVGISGGIDSALVFYLLDAAKKVTGSPIREILPISMPIGKDKVDGVTGQSAAAGRAHLVMESLDYTHYSIDLGGAYNSIICESTDIHADPEKKSWAMGQLASVLRTPVLYYHAAILQAGGRKSVVVGTTNRDEGSYIGFYGKMSDGMVDLQPIADLHKSEVYALSEMLHIPKEIINSVPKGDVWDGRNDEQMIGAPYWFLEMYLLLKQRGRVRSAVGKLNKMDKFWFDVYATQIEELHNINKHKYAVGCQAHFIDVMERKIKGGWQ